MRRFATRISDVLDTPQYPPKMPRFMVFLVLKTGYLDVILGRVAKRISERIGIDFDNASHGRGRDGQYRLPSKRKDCLSEVSPGERGVVDPHLRERVVKYVFAAITEGLFDRS